VVTYFRATHTLSYHNSQGSYKNGKSMSHGTSNEVGLTVKSESEGMRKDVVDHCKELSCHSPGETVFILDGLTSG